MRNTQIIGFEPRALVLISSYSICVNLIITLDSISLGATRYASFAKNASWTPTSCIAIFAKSISTAICVMRMEGICTMRHTQPWPITSELIITCARKGSARDNISLLCLEARLILKVARTRLIFIDCLVTIRC